jgi:hypothetical protein
MLIEKSRFARMSNHAIGPYDWGTRRVGGILMYGPPAYLGQIQWKYSDPTRRIRSNVVSATCH